ncbi:MAG: glutamine synthetase beta-grasp domain-containing protein [Synergistes sp.]|nr:glutamine synthetase beta-grasp domain-containing protein [Synergistes sp.]
MQLERYKTDLLKEVAYINLLILDITGNIRNIYLPAARFDDILKNGVRFDASAYGYAEPGDSEMTAVISGSAAFIETQENSKILHILCDVLSPDGEPLEQYPRTVIKKAKDFMAEQKVADTAKVRVVLEYYVFGEAEFNNEEDSSYFRVSLPDEFAGSSGSSLKGTPSVGYGKMMKEDCLAAVTGETVGLLNTVGIPVKSFRREGALPKIKMELDFMDVVQASDMVTLARWIICRAASESGLRVTFMPKPLCGMPGSGMRILQLLEKNGSPLFNGDTFLGLSDAGLSYTAGLLFHSVTGSLLTFACQGTNSYRRLARAGGAPMRAAFSKNLQDAAVRVTTCQSDENVGLEYVAGDAAGNIYFFMAALILAGADGLFKEMNPVWLGYHSREAKKELILPRDLDSALDGLEKDAGYLAPAFPEEFAERWIKIKRAEAEYVYNAPTPQEYELYF